MTKNKKQNLDFDAESVQVHYSLLPGDPFLYPLKTKKPRRFSDVFRGYKKGILSSDGLTVKLPD